MRRIWELIEQRPWLLLLAVGAAFLLGTQLELGRGGATVTAPAEVGRPQQGRQVWSCAMHPHIRQPEPGRCPVCEMDLIPLQGGGEVLAADQLEMTESARQLARIQTQPVQRRFVASQLRLKGKVAYDETRVETLTAWVPGRLERLFVDYTGITVKQGDHLAEMYSPDVFVAERELQEAARAYREALHFPDQRAAESALEILQATRDKLRLWGLSEAVITKIEKGQQPSNRIEIQSPVGGIVIEKLVNSGEYVETGTPLFKIADLEQVWVILEAYETDLPWLRYGQPADIQIPSLPGEAIQGTIAFIDPVLDPGSRTVRVRVNVPNPGLALKPETFVTGLVHSRLARNGRVMEPTLAGKWIAPMHPEIIKERPGRCDICGMALVPAESLGYSADEPTQAPLVIPATSVLFTGKRSIVYVELPESAQPTYQGREIELGPRADDFYIVLAGLEEGERVVSNGAFKIDSALQLQAGPSMMSRPGEGDDAPPPPAKPGTGGNEHQH